MAFLPALPQQSDASKKRKPDKQREETKKYRLSLLDVAKGSTSLPRLSHCEVEKEPSSSQQNDEHFPSNRQKTEVGKQISLRLRPLRIEPIVTKSQQSPISRNKMVWVEPFGLWVSRKKAKMLYEKFSSKMDLLCKDPDYLMDPCPHIPRCNHSRSWSAVKLERKKFRELSQLRNEQLFHKTLERYRNMQSLWLQQLNCASKIQQTTSSQARLENFRNFAGACFNPMNEVQRLERLKERHMGWEMAWEQENEHRRIRNSTRNICPFPKIVVTDHDTDYDVIDTIDMTSYDLHEEVLNIMLRQVELSRADHEDTIVDEQYVEELGDNYEIVCTPVVCCSQLEDKMTTVDDIDRVETQHSFIHETKNELQREESFAEKRTTPGRVFKPYERTTRRRKIPTTSNKSKVANVKKEKYSNEQNLTTKPPEDDIKEMEPKDSLECEIKDPTSLSSISSAEADGGVDSSPTIDDLTDISRSNLALGSMLLDSTIREADNTARLMRHLIPVPLGMTSRKIPDERMTASSELDVYHVANQARLHNEKKDSNGGAWMPRLHDDHPYLQVDLGVVTTVQQVATQGNPETAVKKKRQKRWVTKFSLAFSEDGNEWKDYEESGSVKIFSGNCDSNTVVLNSLESPVETRFIRFKPKKWHKGIAMRVEVFGPRPDTDANPETPQLESRHESPESLSKTDDKESETITAEEEQVFVTINYQSEEKEFDEVEERIMSPVVLRSPLPRLVSPSTPCVAEKELLQSKFRVNHLPIVRVIETDSPPETPNQDEKETDRNNGLTEEKDEVPPNQDDLNALQSTTDKTDETSLPDSNPGTSPNDQRSAAEADRVHQLRRAQLDNSIQRQLMREKIAEERRKLALLQSQKTKESNQELMGTTGDTYLGNFLEKFCIIGKPDNIVYQGVFEKFDEDDDGFLWPEECLEALENVNRNLLTDSHLNFVYRILELCDTHAESGTTFRLFSVIAALSRRVVALNDKMKRLISQCDFKTIDCTLLRAKMLFECYVNEHTKTISRKDLWVGLAAGGLCRAHEAMEDYFGDRQSFDFLDFLTYLPLFQLIHGNVIENPLSAF